MANKLIRDFYAPMPWSWTELENVNPCDLFLGSIYGNQSAEVVNCSNRHPSKLAFSMLNKHERFHGVIMQLHFLFTSFRQNVDKLFNRYDLSEDGIISADQEELPDILFEASGMTYDVIVAGRRLVDHVENTLKSFFGEQSEEYQSWKEQAAGYYDKCLPYALCYHLRNVIEHDFISISTVNFNPKMKTVGLAINLESGILQFKHFNAGVRERLIEYREQRLSDGLSPWLSVGGTISTFEGSVLFLYLWFLLLVKESPCAKELPEIVQQGLVGWNCVVWKVGNNDSYPLYSIDRVYRFSPGNSVDLLFKRDAASISDRLTERYPDIADSIKDLSK